MWRHHIIIFSSLRADSRCQAPDASRLPFDGVRAVRLAAALPSLLRLRKTSAHKFTTMGRRFWRPQVKVEARAVAGSNGAVVSAIESFGSNQTLPNSAKDHEHRCWSSSTTAVPRTGDGSSWKHEVTFFQSGVYSCLFLAWETSSSPDWLTHTHTPWVVVACRRIICHLLTSTFHLHVCFFFLHHFQVSGCFVAQIKREDVNSLMTTHLMTDTWRDWHLVHWD